MPVGQSPHVCCNFIKITASDAASGNDATLHKAALCSHLNDSDPLLAHCSGRECLVFYTVDL